MNECQVVSSLIHREFHSGAKGLSVPRYTPAGWWECDLAHVTKAGYLVEYEVKLTPADFRADAKKRQRNRYGYQGTRFNELEPGYKLDLLASGCPRGPCRFWYVMPRQMVALEQIPEWAGVIWVDQPKSRATHSGRLAPWGVRWLWLQSVRKPRQLHRTKVDQEVVDHMKSVCYYRMIKYYTDAGVVQPIAPSDAPSQESLDVRHI